tara:strand:+ start:44 stop:208 length:165 start_codon:yes stop_codon:yes gene_type:complete
MRNLTKKQMIHILENGLIDNCSEDEKDQVNRFAFGDDFMDDDDKGLLKKYKEVK